MRYLLACSIRAVVEGCVGVVFALFLLLCAALAGLGKLYSWAVHASETPDQRAEREHEEWKWR